MIKNSRGSIFSQDDDPFTEDRLLELVANAYSIRSDMLRSSLESRKDVNKECDYPETENLDIRQYREMYDRNPVAARVNDILPEKTWQIPPVIYEDDDPDNETEFEKALKELSKTLRGERSWFDGDEGNPLWEYLARLDKLAGIGHFGLLLLGIDDGKELSQPIDGFRDVEEGSSGPIYIQNARRSGAKLIYMAVFDESAVGTSGVVYETNRNSPRYRKPKYYNIDLGSDWDSSYVAVGREIKTVQVHWSRVIHVCDNIESSEVIGVPRQRAVWNHLLNIRKISGGAAEGFWKNCVMRLFLETHPQLGGDVTVDSEGLKQALWDQENGLQRWLLLKGMSAKTVGPQIADPTGHINAEIQMICVKLGIAQRVFMGSERGELASSQDADEVQALIRGRRRSYVTPRMIIPFIDRLIQIGVLPEPSKYKVEWADEYSPKPLERADLASKKMEVLTKFISGQGESLLDPMDLYTQFLDMDEEEARGILERASQGQLEKVDKQAELQTARQDAGLIPPGPNGEQATEKGQSPAEGPLKEGDKKDTATPQAEATAEKAGNKAPPPPKVSKDPKVKVLRKKAEDEGQGGEKEPTENAFCPTGQGGGVDPSCSGGESAVDLDGIFSKTGPSFESFKKLASEVIRETNACGLAGKEGAGACAVSSIRLWDKMGQPKLLVPTSVMSGEEEHVVLREKGSDRIIDLAGNQFGNPVVGSMKKAKYKKPVELTGTEISDLKEELRRAAEQNKVTLNQLTVNEERGMSKPWFELIPGVKVDNVFCKTGIGGGVDPTCGKGGGRSGGGAGSAAAAAVAGESTTPPPPGIAFKPDVERDTNGDGVTDSARVGVPAHAVPPPPGIPQLPNLTPHERAVEESFRKAFEEDPDKMASDFLAVVKASAKEGEPLTFGTDDAKVLTDAWGRDGMSLEERSQNRATLNTALHQTANAVAKRAFVQHLDTLQPGDEILVTVGGCGAGKGYALKESSKVSPELAAMKSSAKVVWDSAGDQNATENPWVLEEAMKRGLKVNYVFVHADPYKQWADPERGVVKRAQDPKDGRMVDAFVFADSYALGAKNHQAFFEKNKDNPNAKFAFLDNTGKPKLVDKIPDEALKISRGDLAEFAIKIVHEREGIPPHVKRGATIGTRIWGEP